MILVDSRVGSVELAKWISRSKVCTLEFGDFAFSGNGPNEKKIMVGVERKTISDWASSLHSGRFMQHQLPGLLKAYKRVYLIIEGLWCGNVDGSMVEWKEGRWVELRAKITSGEFLGRQITIAEKTGVVVLQSPSMHTTARMVSVLANWWQSKAWKDHRSHVDLEPVVDTGILRKPTVKMKVASCLPGISGKRAVKVANAFTSVQEMANSEMDQWVEIEGIGKKTAQRAIAVLQGRGRTEGCKK